jgi:hypothetical protein
MRNSQVIGKDTSIFTLPSAAARNTAISRTGVENSRDNR